MDGIISRNEDDVAQHDTAATTMKPANHNTFLFIFSAIERLISNVFDNIIDRYDNRYNC